MNLHAIAMKQPNWRTIAKELADVRKNQPRVSLEQAQIQAMRVELAKLDALRSVCEEMRSLLIDSQRFIHCRKCSADSYCETCSDQRERNFNAVIKAKQALEESK